MTGPDPDFRMQPIGYVRCLPRYPYEVPRQAVLADNSAVIELNDDERLRQGLQGLEGFERIWVLGLFDRNPNWRPLVQPPTEGMGRYGVFATRSPHRPNPIGLSCVRLLSIDAGCLRIGDHDLLDGTPVLDIKPYLPYADAFPDSHAGWTEARDEPVYAIELSKRAAAQVAWIREHGQLAIDGFIQAQLSRGPTAPSRKRIDSDGDGYIIAYRTWRLHYTVTGDVVQIAMIRSGYSAMEMAAPEDTYGDKAVHRAFRERWAE